MNNYISKKFNIISLVWKVLTKKRRTQIIIIQLINLLCAFTEVCNLLVIKFFLDGLIDKQFYEKSILVKLFLQNASENNQFIFIGLITIIFVLLSSILRMTIIFFQFRMAALLSVDIGTIVYNNVISRSYSWHIKNNTSLVLGLLSNDVEKVRESINNFFALLINTLLILFIGFPLFLISPTMVFTTIMFVLILFSVVYRKSRTSLEKEGTLATKSYQNGMKLISESLGSIKDILINNNKRFFLKNYIENFKRYNISIGTLQYRYQSPRFLVEGILLSMIIIISIFLNFSKISDGVNLSVVSVVFIGIYKLLIPFQQCSSAISTLKSNKASWERIKPYMKARDAFNMSLKKSIYRNFNKFEFLKLENINFRYDKNSKWIIKNLNLNIKRGQRVGFVGYSGYGKTTCGDLISGLLKPNIGSIFLNGKNINASKANFQNWHNLLSIVPQNVYLIEDTFVKNIAFGIASEDINFEKVIDVSKKACLHETILELPKGYYEIVGEKANKLSGGQIQRLAIARALYKEAEFILFDEATSALDNKTESKLMESLEMLDNQLTMIFIAHRLSTIKNCDFLVFFEKDGTITIGKFEELIKSKKFREFLNEEKSLDI